MGLKDRPYWRDDSAGGGGMGARVGFAMPKPAQGVLTLLIVNAAVFVVQLFADQPDRYHAGRMTLALGVTAESWWQLWRYVTFQFLHADFWHIALNMLGLYFFGVPLERSWGTKRFVRFYLTCGVVAGLAYVVIDWLYLPSHDVPIIGASGGVFACLMACAILFPQFKVILYFFPVPIRLAAGLIFGGMILLVLQSMTRQDMDRAMSDVAHLGGAVAAAFWVLVLPRLRQMRRDPRANPNPGGWHRKVEREQKEDDEVDHILEKIRTHGIESLSRSEKKALQSATRRKRMEEP